MMGRMSGALVAATIAVAAAMHGGRYRARRRTPRLDFRASRSA